MKIENKASNTPGSTSTGRGCVLKHEKQSTAGKHRDPSFPTLPILALVRPATGCPGRPEAQGSFLKLTGE